VFLCGRLKILGCFGVLPTVNIGVCVLDEWYVLVFEWVF
jgi:hypothetical protein